MIGSRPLRTVQRDNESVERVVELRKLKRYYVQAPALFSWKDADGSLRAGEGATRDISMQAVFVICRECPPTGDQLRLDVLLPSLRGTPGVRLRGEGVVLRVDHSDSQISGFVVATRLHSDTRGSSDLLFDLGDGSWRVQ